MRKPTKKRKQELRTLFDALIDGIKDKRKDTWYQWTVATRYGSLHLDCQEHVCAVFGRFDKPVDGLTGPSGKYNHHFAYHGDSRQSFEDMCEVWAWLQNLDATVADEPPTLPVPRKRKQAESLA